MKNDMNEMQEIKIKVYAKVDENGNITEVNSSIFLTDTTGWIEIDEGVGDRYALAQGNYFETPLRDIYGNPLYRYVDGEIVANPPYESDPAVMLEQQKQAKYAEFDSACEQAIIRGAEIETSHGKRLFTFSLADQNNINDAVNTIRDVSAGVLAKSVIADGIPFKAADGECLFYTSEDITKVDLYKKAWILYQRTYLSALLAWCETLTLEEVKAIKYGDNLPKQYQEHVNAVMLPLNELTKV